LCDNNNNTLPNAGLVGIPLEDIASNPSDDDGDYIDASPNEVQAHMDSLGIKDYALQSSSTLYF
jgi:hypothetical protein